MQLLLVRHAESTWNATGRIQGWADPPLTERGRSEAIRIARRLNGDGTIDALYSSSSLRALQTAQLIGEELGLTPRVDERLREESVGELRGLTAEEVKAQYPDFWRSWHEDPRRPQIPGGESIESFLGRVVEVMEEIVSAHGPDTRVAVVSHGGTFGVYLAHLIGLDVHNWTPFWFDNASLSVIGLDRVRPRIISLNDTCHLNGLA